MWHAIALTMSSHIRSWYMCSGQWFFSLWSSLPFPAVGSCIPYSMRLCVHVHTVLTCRPREKRAREQASERERTVSIKYRQSPLLQLQLSGITTSRSEPASDSVAPRKTRRINGGHTLKFYLLTIAAHRWGGGGGECDFEDARSPMCFNSTRNSKPT